MNNLDEYHCMSVGHKLSRTPLSGRNSKAAYMLKSQMKGLG